MSVTVNTPNVIIITSDQQRLDSMSCAGSPFVRTPNLDRLAAGGAFFSRAYCSNPVCTPARASIFSGQNVSRHGAWNVGTKIPPDVTLLTHRLSALGYRTHSIGKLHFQPFGHDGSEECIKQWNDGRRYTSGPYYGFETVELSCGHTTYGMTGPYGEWILERIGGDREMFEGFKRASARTAPDFGGNAADMELPVKYQSSVWTAERACAFLRDEGAKRPFLLNIGFQDPHHPHAVPRDYANRVDPAAVPLPVYREGELEDKPPHFRLARTGDLESSRFRGEFSVAGAGRNYDRATPEAARLGRAYYYTLVQLIDDQMGRILDCLEEQGLADNTLVVYTTDHGELLGDHGLWLKGPFHYEELINIPMIVRWPGGFRAGLRSEALFSQVDITPTVMAAVGRPCGGEVDGVDLGPVLRGDTEAMRTHALVECVDDPGKLRLKTVVTSDRKLTWYAGQNYGELYDLRSEERDRRNLWSDPGYGDDKTQLLSRMLGEMERSERREARWCYA